MAKWQRELNLLPEWRDAQDGKITPQDMAKIISARLRTLAPFGTGLDFDRDELADQFDDFARDVDAEADDFDQIMQDLYDWADTHISGDFFNAKKACWVRTF